MNRQWVNEKLGVLFSKIGNFKSESEVYFEPTEEIYKQLETGNEKDLQEVINSIAKYLILNPIPTVTYDWGLKFKPEVAGQIRLSSPTRHIQIPFFFVGKKYPLGAIIAHEMTHAFLYSKEIFLSDPNENEMLTDLATIFIGLGKLLLNGLKYRVNEYSGMEYSVGYLSPELISYGYNELNKCRLVNEKNATMHLTQDAMERIKNIGNTS